MLGAPLVHFESRLDIGQSEELDLECFHRNLLVGLTHNDAVVNREAGDAMRAHQLKQPYSTYAVNHPE